MDHTIEPLAVSVTDARRHLGGISAAGVYRLIGRKKLDKRRIAGRTVITMASIRELLDEGMAA